MEAERATEATASGDTGGSGFFISRKRMVAAADYGLQFSGWFNKSTYLD